MNVEIKKRFEYRSQKRFSWRIFKNRPNTFTPATVLETGDFMILKGYVFWPKKKGENAFVRRRRL